MGHFQIADKTSKVADSYVEAFFFDGKWQWELTVKGEDMPEWGNLTPRLGTFDDFMEMNDETFNPLLAVFHHTLYTQGFWFTIGGECIPVNSIEVQLSRTAEQWSRGVLDISVIANVDVLYDDEYDANIPMSLNCEGYFKEVKIDKKLVQDEKADLNLIYCYLDSRDFNPIPEEPYFRRYQPNNLKERGSLIR